MPGCQVIYHIHLQRAHPCAYGWYRCVCAHLQSRSTPAAVPWNPSTLFFEIRLFPQTWGSPIRLGWLTSEPPELPVSTSLHWNYRQMSPHPVFLWVLGMELKPLCLDNRHFDDWATSPVLEQWFSKYCFRAASSTGIIEPLVRNVKFPGPITDSETLDKVGR